MSKVHCLFDEGTREKLRSSEADQREDKLRQGPSEFTNKSGMRIGN